MHPKCKIWERKLWLAATGFLMSFSLIGGACSGVGRIIAPEQRIALSTSGENSGQWQSMDAFLKYRYTTDGQPAGNIRISGSVSARSRVDQLAVSIRFLDAQGKVLGGEQIYNSGYRIQSIGGEFNRTLALPVGTQAVAFSSYSQPHQGQR